MSALRLAINSNKPDDVEALLRGGWDPNALLDHHFPLFHAILQARPQMVESFIRFGADPNRRDRMTGWTPLMMATINSYRSPRRHFTGRAIKDSKRIVKILSEAGASDPETSFVLGHYLDDKMLARRITERGTLPDERTMSLDNAIVLIPPRVLKNSRLWRSAMTIKERVDLYKDSLKLVAEALEDNAKKSPTKRVAGRRSSKGRST